MRQKIGVAIVGAGRIAHGAHFPAWAESGMARVVHVVDSDPEVAQRSARRWEVPAWSTSLDAALACEDVDVVDICTPPALHTEQATKAMEAGRHVVVEKPAAPTEAGVRQIADVSARTGMTAMVCENWAFAPAARHAMRLIQDGAIGAPRLFTSEHFSGASLLPHHGAGPRGIDGSYLVNMGIHTINVSVLLMGEYREVSAYGHGQPDGDADGDGEHKEVVVAAQFRAGGIGSMFFSGLTQSKQPGSRLVRVVGTEGRIEFDIFTKQVRWTDGHVWAKQGAEHLWQDGSPSNGHPETIRHFLECLREHREPLTSAAALIPSHRAVDAILQSVESGKTVCLGAVAQQVMSGAG